MASGTIPAVTSTFETRQETRLVDADRLLRLRERLQAVGAALETYTDPVAWRRASLRVEHIAALAPRDLDAAEQALEGLERGMEARGTFR